MNRKLLASAICASLLVAGTAFAKGAASAPQQAQDTSTASQANTSSSQDQKKDEKKKTLGTITVTGSLIPQSQVETASPVITITAQDLQKQGFKNVYDALRALPTANGAVQDNQFTQGFTPGAEAVSLLGLDPSFTLVLLNGRPMADYPLPYNSTSNFVDFGTIPSTLVDRIEIVPGNQSAIYGSAAIAGVINIILKQHMEGVTIDYRAGGYTQGGGQQQRLQISGGHTFGKLDLMGAVEINKQNPIFGYQRSIQDSTMDSPRASSRVPAFDRIALDAFTGQAIPPPGGAAGCDPSLFHGSNEYAYSARYGYYCGSYTSPAYGTIMNGSSRANFYGKATYQLNNNTQLYADLLYNVSKVKYLTGGNYSVFWNFGQGTAPYIYDLDSQALLSTTQHIFAPEEVGNLADRVGINRAWIFNAGAKGNFGDSDWTYDAYYHRSEYENAARGRRPLTAKVNDFFLGPQDGTDPYGYGYPAYHLGGANGHFWGAATPQEFAGFSDYIRSKSKTYTQQGAVTVTNTDLFNLPAGSVGFAGQLTLGNQSWNNPIDPRVLSGDFWGIGGTSGEGKRGFSAAAAEFSVPIFKMLTADLSGRYDRYSPDGGSSQGKFTWKAGLEFRPLDTLLFRANYATAFRAPDMAYLFSAGSKSYGNVTDVYNCRVKYGNDLGDCKAPYSSVQITQTADGNRDLQYITAKSWGYGVVWSPIKNLTLKSDYYHVKIANEVSNYSASAILGHEADCRIGTTIQGTPVDVNSPSCQMFLSQVTRTPLNAPINPGSLSNVSTMPINISRESVSGIQASGNYAWDWGRFGDFNFGLNYAVQTSHIYQQFPGDEPTDVLRTNAYGNQFKNIGVATFGWDIGNWSTTLQYQRFGKTFSYDGKFTVGPWMRYNATIQYHVTPGITATLIGNNIFDARPPYDRSYTAYPYFDIFSYNDYGRLIMLELNIKLP